MVSGNECPIAAAMVINFVVCGQKPRLIVAATVISLIQSTVDYQNFTIQLILVNNKIKFPPDQFHVASSYYQSPHCMCCFLISNIQHVHPCLLHKVPGMFYTQTFSSQLIFTTKKKSFPPKYAILDFYISKLTSALVDYNFHT